MEQIISKEEIGELMKMEGETRGDGIKSYMDFIIEREGEEGLQRLEEKLAEMGYPIKYKEIKRMDFYSVGVWALVLSTIQRLFNYDEKKFQEMGAFQVKTSLLIRMFMKYFFSIERAARELPKIWNQYFTVGSFKTTSLDKGKKRIVLKLDNFHIHPAGCQIILGVLVEAIKMITRSEVKGEQKECIFKGGDYHEFLITW